ncbi:MAG: dockerin type I domain-containing protein, partial [Bacillota bacterium]|nr:dockerin type I domain-containing protein [Bacillota bacterium]
AKFIRPGYHRVDATANPNTNVYVSAYTGDNKVTVVAINSGTSAVSQKFNIQGGSPSSVSSYITDSSRNMATGSTINVSGGSFTAQLPAQSITTFVGNIGSVISPSPTFTPTYTPTNKPTNTNTPTSTPTNTPTSKPVVTGDLNHDGAINMADVILIANVFNSVRGDSKYVAAYDLNNDGALNISDVIIIATKFNTVVS